MEVNSIDELTDCAKRTYQRLMNQINNTELFVKVARTHWKKPNLYKTEICDHWRNKRKCNYGVRCWYAHGLQELRSSTSGSVITSSNFSASDSTSTDSPLPIMPSSDGSLSGMPPSGSSPSNLLDNQFQQMSLVPSNAGQTSATSPYNAVQPPLQHFGGFNAISFASNSFNISTNAPNVPGLSAPFNFASSGLHFGANGTNVAINPSFNLASNGFNFGASGMNFGMSSPFNFASSGFNFNTSGLNIGLGDLKISRTNIWD